jgi:dTDP-4-dehydrorhamnose 3,5-epimerase
MKIEQTRLPGVVVITMPVFTDERGFFMESYKQSSFAAHGLPTSFCQDNYSNSSKGVLRGLHYQLPPFAQGKLVRVVQGAVWDVAVDIRRSSPSFKQWVGVELSAENRAMLWVPPGFAHGFVALTDNVHFLYKCTAEYNRGAERGVCWNDPELAIKWPLDNPLISPRDAVLPELGQADLFD